MNKKAIIGICCGVAAIAAIVLVIVLMNKGDDLSNIRNISVFEMNGSVKIARDGKNMDAVKNMKLRSGDDVEVGDGSYLRLCLDDDKYVYADAGTKMRVIAEGTAANSKTRIAVAEGTVITEVQNKLSGDSSFDVVTPNSTMAIRGTSTYSEVKYYKPEPEEAPGASIDEYRIIEKNAILEGSGSISYNDSEMGTAVNTNLGAGEGITISKKVEKKPLLDELSKHPVCPPATLNGADYISFEETLKKL